MPHWITLYTKPRRHFFQLCGKKDKDCEQWVKLNTVQKKKVDGMYV